VAVKIRLKRMGKIRAPHYRIVIVDSRKKRDGKVIEEIGLYHPKEDPSYISVVSDRAQYWLGVGAQPSEAVHKLLRITGDWQKFKGIDGTEGTLKTAEPKRDKLEIFNEALKDAGNEPKTEAVTRRTTKKAAAKAEEPKAEEPKAEEKPAEEAPVEVVAEEAAPVPADETPEGAADKAETAETAEVDAEAKSDEA
jgi:small subunit ribosomal protein S16